MSALKANFSKLKKHLAHKFSKKSILAQILVFNLTFMLLFTFFINRSYGATATWDNSSADGKWSTCANWTGGTGAGGCPGTGDIATFDSTSNTPVSIDASVSVAGINITTGYTDTITQAATFTIAVGTSGWSQSTGTFTGGDSAITITNGSFSLTGGTFTPSSGGLTLDRDFTVSGSGNYNVTTQTLTITGSASESGDDTTFSCPTSIGGTINISKVYSLQDFILSSGCSISPTSMSMQSPTTISGTLTIGNGLTFTFYNGFDSSLGTVTNNGTISITADTTDSNDDTTFDCNGSIGGTGTITISKVYTIQDFILSSGCSIAPSSMSAQGPVTISGTLTIGNGLTFTFYNGFDSSLGTVTNNGTISITADTTDSNDDTTFDCNGSIGGTGQITLAKVYTIQDFILSSGCSIAPSSMSTQGPVTISGTLTIGNGLTFTFYNGFDSSLGTVTNNGTISITADTTDSNDDTTFDCNGSIGGTGQITLAKVYSLQIFTLNSGCEITIANINSTDMGDMTIGGTLNVTGTFDYNSSEVHAFIINNGGTVTYSGTNITMTGSLTQNGTFNLTGKTITFDGGDVDNDSTITCTGNLGGTVNITKALWGTNVVIASGCTVSVNNINSTDMGSLTVSGRMDVTGTFDLNQSEAAGLIINPDAIVTYSGTDITINGSLTQNGTFNLTGKTITFDGADIDNDTTLICGSPLAGNIVVNHTSSGANFTLGGNCTVQGNFTRTDGPVTNPASAYTLTVEGNFSMSTTDTFGGANLTLKFSGTADQTITQNAGSMSNPVTIDKTAGTVSLATAFTIDSTGSTLTFSDGLFRNNGLALTVAGNFTISDTFEQGSGNVSAGTYTLTSNGTWENKSTGDVTVGAGGVINSGDINFDGSGTGCGGTDTVAITSSSAGVQRSWTGNGRFRMYDVTVTDQGGTASIIAYSSNSVSGNDTNWDFQAGCETISPVNLRGGAFIRGGTTIRKN